MRSSPPTTHNFTADVFVDSGEAEALLDDYVSENGADSDVDVVVDGARESEVDELEDTSTHTHKLRHRNYLYQDISTSLAMLRVIQGETIPASQKWPSCKIKLYATAALIFGVTVVVVPGYFLKQLVEIGVIGSEETVECLKKLYADLVYKQQAAHELYLKAKDYYEYLLNYHAGSQSELDRAWTEMDDLRANWNAIGRQMQDVNHQFNDAKYVDIESTITVIAGSIAAIIALVAAAIIYNRCHGTYKEEISKTLLLNEYLNNPAEANALINLLGRLNLKIDDTTTVAGLIAALETKQHEIDERWKQRTAFMNGFKCSGSSSHLFFKQADRNLVKMIFDEAGLGPVQKPNL